MFDRAVVLDKKLFWVYFVMEFTYGAFQIMAVVECIGKPLRVSFNVINICIVKSFIWYDM